MCDVCDALNIQSSNYRKQKVLHKNNAINRPLSVAMQAGSITQNDNAGSNPKPIVILRLSLSV
jgi:hypothetical protein